jgi:hypothetical protein
MLGRKPGHSFLVLALCVGDEGRTWSGRLGKSGVTGIGAFLESDALDFWSCRGPDAFGRVALLLVRQAQERRSSCLDRIDGAEQLLSLVPKFGRCTNLRQEH